MDCLGTRRLLVANDCAFQRPMVATFVLNESLLSSFFRRWRLLLQQAFLRQLLLLCSSQRSYLLDPEFLLDFIYLLFFLSAAQSGIIRKPFGLRDSLSLLIVLFGTNPDQDVPSTPVRVLVFLLVASILGPKLGDVFDVCRFGEGYLEPRTLIANAT